MSRITEAELKASLAPSRREDVLQGRTEASRIERAKRMYFSGQYSSVKDIARIIFGLPSDTELVRLQAEHEARSKDFYTNSRMSDYELAKAKIKSTTKVVAEWLGVEQDESNLS